LRSENEVPARPAVVERLLSEAIAYQAQQAFAAIPKREGKHADQALQRTFQAPDADCLKQGFCVAMPAPPALRGPPPHLKLSAQSSVIVDLAIVDDHPSAVGRRHRLMPLR